MRIQALVVAFLAFAGTMACRPAYSQPATAAPPPTAPARVVDFPNLKRYQPDNAALPPPAAGKSRVVFMGDSITEGWAAKRPAFFESNGYVGRGISGQTTSQMVLRFHQDVVALKPAVVVVIAGTNDVAENTGPMTDDQIVENLATMVEIARAHGIRPVVGSIPPATSFFWRKEIVPTARIRDLNLKLRAWAQAEKVTYADVWTAMASPDGGMNPAFADDTVHPNDAGYSAMEPIVHAAITAAMKSVP
jgi:lysophospholipase L1-like esterase